MVTIPVMPEILESIEEASKDSSFDEQALYNSVSGYFVVCQGIGESFGPLTSALLSL